MGKIDLQGIFNARDMGGFAAADGKTVKPRRLIRSDALRDLTEDDKRILTGEYGLRNVIDLRTAREIGEKPDPEMDGVSLLHIPLIKGGPAAHKVDEEKTMAQLFKESIEEMRYDAASAMKNMYESLLADDFSKGALRDCFDVFLGSEEGSTLFHCTAGKDRTGLITILMLDTFGVDRGAISADYMETNEHLRPQTEWIAREVSKTDDDPKLIEQINVLNTVIPEYAEAIFARIDEIAGGSENYLRSELRLSEGDIADLKKLYLE